MSLKRSFDVAVAAIGIVVSIPVVLSAGFSMAVINKSSPIFKQRRTGLNNKPFTLYKIKSMRDCRDSNGAYLPDSKRTSRLGKFLRTSRLDELPQLYNVLKGDMSIVGPRPLPNYEDEKRHSVKPGITGLSQIAGGNMLSPEDRLRLDYRYVETRSLSDDFMICCATPISLVMYRNVPHFREDEQLSKSANQNIPK